MKRPLLTDLAERVERGAKLLDLKMPGWWRSIRTTHLDMNEGGVELGPDGRPLEDDWCGCIGAQISLTHKRLNDGYVADWNYVMDELGLDTVDEERAHGFLLHWNSEESERRELDALWIEQVRARRKAAS